MIKIKICKTHGDLKEEDILFRKNNKGNKINVCGICKKQQDKKSYEKHKDRKIKCNLEYTRKNKEIINIMRKRTREKNKEKLKVDRKEKNKKQCEQLTDNYVRKLLSRFSSLKYKDIPDELVQLKRYTIAIKRHVKENDKM